MLSEGVRPASRRKFGISGISSIAREKKMTNYPRDAGFLR
jgi:hypothetical protein